MAIFAFILAAIGTIPKIWIFPQNAFRRQNPFMRPTVYGSYVAVLLSLSSAGHAQSVTEDIQAKAQRLVILRPSCRGRIVVHLIDPARARGCTDFAPSARDQHHEQPE